MANLTCCGSRDAATTTVLRVGVASLTCCGSRDAAYTFLRVGMTANYVDKVYDKSYLRLRKYAIESGAPAAVVEYRIAAVNTDIDLDGP